MKRHVAIPTVLLALAALLLLAACGGGGDAGSSGGDTAAPPVAQPAETPAAGAGPADSTASVRGTVSYRERIALSPGARLEVALLDTSLQDAAATTIAEQAIDNPGQVPISFEIEYDPADIREGNTYSLHVAIIEADGSLAFTNDTAYDVITNGNPSEADVEVVQVQSSYAGPWEDVPARIVSANLAEGEAERHLRVTYRWSGGEDCVGLGASEAAVEDGYVVRAAVTVRQTPGASCGDGDGETEALLPLDADLALGERYHVVVNDVHTSTFSLPREGFPESALTQSYITSAELLVLEKWPPAYQVLVTAELWQGSGCSQLNGYDIARRTPNTLDVTVTHHYVTANNIACTADIAVEEFTIALGEDFVSGETYTVNINEGEGGVSVPFTAQ